MGILDDAMECLGLEPEGSVSEIVPLCIHADDLAVMLDIFEGGILPDIQLGADVLERERPLDDLIIVWVDGSVGQGEEGLYEEARWIMLLCNVACMVDYVK
jgi:hypothetical protein